jgi:hypothetical protein
VNRLLGRRSFTHATGLAIIASLLVAGAPPGTEARPSPVASEEVRPAKSERVPPGRENDAVSARAAAARKGMPVEIASMTDEFSLTVANPDGTLTTELSAGPERVYDPDLGDGGGWLDIDLQLSRVDGRIRPAVAPADIAFSDGGTEPLIELSTPDRGGMRLRWAGVVLPEPELDGNVARYRDVEPGVDLELEASPTGYAKRIVVRERPSVAPVWRFEIQPDDLETALADDGMPELVDEEAETVVVFDGLWMWGAEEHDQVDEPVRVAEVDSRLIDRRGVSILEVAPDLDFLTDPTVRLPITIDPTATIPNENVSRDTFVQSNIANTAQSGSAELRVGTFDGTTVARSLLLFDTSLVNGTNVQEATLQLYNDHSWSCSKRSLNVLRNTEPFTNSTVWGTRPAAGSAVTSPTFAHGYSSSCPNAWQDLDVTAIVRSWASGTQPNHGFQLRATNESETAGWKKFRSSDAASGRPKMRVTYNSYPLAPSSRTVTPAAVNGYRPSLTPTFNATFRDPDGGTGRVRHTLLDATGTQVAAGWGPTVSAGTNSPWTVGADLLKNGQTYTWRTRGHDGTDYGAFAADATITIDALGPTAPTISSTSHPTQTTWYAARDIVTSWTASTDSPAGVQDYAVRLTKDPSTVPSSAYAQADRRFSGTATSDGVWYLHVRPRDNAGNWGAVTRRELRVSTGTPTDVEIGSTSHPDQRIWYPRSRVEATWTAATATSGIAGYAVRFDQDPLSVPTASDLRTARTFSAVAPADGLWYLHVRPRDGAGNWGEVTRREIRVLTSPATATPVPQDRWGEYATVTGGAITSLSVVTSDWLAKELVAVTFDDGSSAVVSPGTFFDLAADAVDEDWDEEEDAGPDPEFSSDHMSISLGEEETVSTHATTDAVVASMQPAEALDDDTPLLDPAFDPDELHRLTVSLLLELEHVDDVRAAEILDQDTDEAEEGFGSAGSGQAGAFAAASTSQSSPTNVYTRLKDSRSVYQYTTFHIYKGKSGSLDGRSGRWWGVKIHGHAKSKSIWLLKKAGGQVQRGNDRMRFAEFDPREDRSRGTCSTLSAGGTSKGMNIGVSFPLCPSKLRVTAETSQYRTTWTHYYGKHRTSRSYGGIAWVHVRDGARTDFTLSHHRTTPTV